jgi:uncharacterized protein YecE (DUF72 family)
MQLYTGTSGFAYKEWKGTFYPEDLRNDGMLSYYATQFRAVEINNSFYRMPAEKTLAQWSEQVPPHFRFVLKAPQRITHFTRLKQESKDPLEFFLKTAASLGPQLGPLLFQLPPNLKLDLPRLQTFLSWIPADVRAAFEFRHNSWFEEPVYDALRAANAALCIADTEEEQTPRIATATDWGYLRLRRVAYSEADVAEWAGWTRGQAWTDAFVFFKHEDAGTGPRLAREFEAAFMGSREER